MWVDETVIAKLVPMPGCIVARILAFAFAMFAAAQPACRADASENDLQTLSMLVDTPPGHGAQREIDLVARLARAHNVAALDLLIQKHPAWIDWYVRNYRASLRGAPAPELEQRLLEHYDEPAVAAPFLSALERYESPLLADKLVADVQRYARHRAAQAKECRVAPGHGIPPGYQGRRDQMPTVWARLDCPAALAAADRQREVERWRSAVWMVGKTQQAGIAARVTPYIEQLGSMPATDPAVRELGMPQNVLARISDLQSIAASIQRERYVQAGHPLVTVLRRLEGRTVLESRAAFPLLQALSVVGSDEARFELERWIELRSRQPSTGMEPRLADMIALLGSAESSHAGEITALRDRVLANVRYAELASTSAAFRRLSVLGSNPAGVAY